MLILIQQDSIRDLVERVSKFSILLKILQDFLHLVAGRDVINKLFVMLSSVSDVVDHIFKMFDSELAEEVLRHLVQLNILTEADSFVVVVDQSSITSQTASSCASEMVFVDSRKFFNFQNNPELLRCIKLNSKILKFSNKNLPRVFLIPG